MFAFAKIALKTLALKLIQILIILFPDLPYLAHISE